MNIFWQKWSYDVIWMVIFVKCWLFLLGANFASPQFGSNIDAFNVKLWQALYSFVIWKSATPVIVWTEGRGKVQMNSNDQSFVRRIGMDQVLYSLFSFFFYCWFLKKIKKWNMKIWKQKIIRSEVYFDEQGRPKRKIVKSWELRGSKFHYWIIL